jgi:hypothetical protein
MLRCLKCFAVLASLSLIFSANCSYAEEDLEDLIDLFESNRKIIAVIEGNKTNAVNLRLEETVLWHGSSGYMGALLTNHSFYVISVSSGRWQSLPLKIQESEKAAASLSPYIALLVTKDRAVVFDAASSRFIETPLPIYDELVSVKVENFVAVVVTSGRAFGFAEGTSAFAMIPLRVRETVESVKITSGKAVIHTSDRLLTFEKSGHGWHEHRLK